MLTETRYSRILEELDARGTVTVTQLTESLGVSESTIRRDLNALAEMGKLNKVHGGAVALQQQYVSDEAPFSMKEALNVEEKQAIARYAASIITDEDFVFVDAGSTTSLLIDYLENTKAVFVTNGITQIQKLLHKNLTAYMIGGYAKPVTEATVGADAVENLKRYNFTKCFLGTNGIHESLGFSTVDVEEAAVKHAAAQRSYSTFVLADSSKFDKVTAVTFAEIHRATIITDRLEDPRYAELTVVKEVMAP